MLGSGKLGAVLAVAGMAVLAGAGTAVPAVAAAAASQSGAGPGGFGFGSNGFGELGDGSTIQRNSPVPVTGLPGTVRQVSAGYAESAALLSDGTVWAWGSNYSGILGNGSYGGLAFTPRQVPGLSAITQISLGVEDAYAVRSDGSVWAWGLNGSGQLGNGTVVSSFTPRQVPGLAGITQVSAGQDYVLARQSNGTVWAWGDNTYAELGDGTWASHRAPERVSGLTGITQVTAAEDFASFAVRSDGTLFAWGNNSNGDLGHDSSAGVIITPAPVPGVTGVTQVANAFGVTLAVAGSGGSVWGWGYSVCGQLGNGTALQYVPRQVPGLAGITQIATGPNGDSGAVRSDGALFTWGCNSYGNLGRGTSGGPPLTSAPVLALTGVSQIAFGGGSEAGGGEPSSGGDPAGFGLAVGFAAYATVPDLSDDTTAQAGQALQAVGLVLGTVNTVIDNFCNNIGTVISQNPRAGVTVGGGTAVSITIGRRPPHPCP